MTEKEAKIIAYALQLLNSNWDEMHEDNLYDIAIDKDIQFLQRKYEGLSRPYMTGKNSAYEL
jgi:hypothetical protein